MRTYRNGWLEWNRKTPGHYLSENGKWQIRKEGSRWHTYIKDQYDETGRYFRLDRVPPCRTLEDAQDHVDEYDTRGLDALLENPRHPKVLAEFGDGVDDTTATGHTYVTKRKARRLYGKDASDEPDLKVVEGHDTVHYYSTAILGIPANEGVTEQVIRLGGRVKAAAWKVAGKNRERRISTQKCPSDFAVRRQPEKARSVPAIALKKQEAVQVYCDGACKPNPGAVYIGVFCDDPVIEIGRKIQMYGTNNDAECLAAIAALEECKRLNLGGVELLSDSQLVVGWTNGGFRWRSATALEYVPTIRQLLREVGGRLTWIPGKKNLADGLSKSLMPSALDRELATMKSGRDEFSRLKKPKLMDSVGVEAWNQIAGRIDKEKYQLSAARWFLRGLSLDTAIRKVEAQREIGHDYHNYACAADE